MNAQFLTDDKLITSVGRGSSLLGKAGLLDGREITTHWRAFNSYKNLHQKKRILKNVRFILSEPIFTFVGISAGMDFSLRIIRHFLELK